MEQKDEAIKKKIIKIIVQKKEEQKYNKLGPTGPVPLYHASLPAQQGDEVVPQSSDAELWKKFVKKKNYLRKNEFSFFFLVFF